MNRDVKSNEEVEIREIGELNTVEVRAEGDERVIKGYAAVYSKWTHIGDPKYGWEERIEKGAFKKSIEENSILQLRDHDWGKVLGRTGRNLKLFEDDKGLGFELRVPNTPLGDETLELVREKIITGCSFGAMVRNDKWEFDREKEMNYRTLVDCDLLEVTLTPIPAYQQTSATARSKAAEISATQEVDLEWEKRKADILAKYKSE